MRLVRLLVGTDRLAELTEVLDGESIDYVITEERERDAVVVEFPLPVQAVEGVSQTLDESGFGDLDYTVVANAETASTEQFEELEAEYVESDDETDSVSGEEVRVTARSLLPDRRTYYAMTVLSALVATAGILLDSPAVVIGSMAIAPQVGAAITASTGIVLGETEMIRDGVRSLALGLLVAVAAATLFGLFLHDAGFISPALHVSKVKQISTRISPGFLSLLLGLCAGSAAALGLATDLPLALVGVAIAAAVVPAAAAVGIGIVWGLPLVALGAGVLLVVNAATILLAGAATLLALGYRAAGRDRESDDDRDGGRLPTSRGTLVAVGTVVLLLLLVSVPGVAVVEHVRTENEINTVARDTLERPSYEALQLRDVQVAFTDLGLLGLPTEATIQVSRPADTTYPSLAGTLEDNVEEQTGKSVVLAVEFVDRQAASESGEEVGRHESLADPAGAAPVSLAGHAAAAPWGRY